METMTLAVSMTVVKFRCPSAKVTLENRTSAASWLCKVFPNPSPDDVFRVEVNPALG